MPPRPALELKIRNIRKGWVGKQFNPAHSLVKIKWPCSIHFVWRMPAELCSQPFGTGIRQFMVSGFPRNLLIQFNPWNISVRFKHVTGGRNEPIKTVAQVFGVTQ
ncbi:hypothetical protein CEXT_812271 [Caerostris extrusa]|uniref:Uncharacterized protein n=1 Tax=Caerostris extrusa TaxID=172846 RepID=A0AAV4PHH5_CAEEX|nr:hypothetical protein CEXT_812271 [Caerostris extrusa]